MAKSKLILAVAGAGKTYRLAEELKAEQRNIFITFTNKNVENLLREIKNIHGQIPQNTLVITYAKFVYNWLIKPINPLLKIGSEIGIKIKGIDLYTDPEEQWKNNRINPLYIAQGNSKHYVNGSNQIYISRMVKLFNKQNRTIKNLAFARLAQYCDNLLIDEVQDFRTEDYDLLVELIKLKQPKTIGVGDYYQHSVSFTEQRLGRPFSKKKQDIPYGDYIKNEEKHSVVDTESLIRSRRVPESICEFIREKLSIEIYSKSEKEGSIELIESPERLEDILSNSDITKVIYRGSSDYTFIPAINWSYSKGDTYENTCVVLTNTFKELFNDDFSIKDIPQQEINKLYVALTRTKNNLYIVKRDLFAEVHDKFKLS